MAHTITAVGSPVEWQTTEGQRVAAVQLDSTHWLAVYVASVAAVPRGFAIVFTVDGSGVPSTVGTAFEFDSFTSGTDQFSEVTLYDSDTAVVSYKGTDADGFIKALSINTSTWDVTSGGAALEYETDALTTSSIVKVPGLDAFVIAARATAGNDGHSYSLTFDPGTGAFTLQNNFEFDTTNASVPTVLNLNNDPTKYIVTYEGANGDGFAEILSLNTSTWVLSTQSTLEFDTADGRFIEMVELDASHFLLQWNDGTLAQNRAQVIEVNLSTWAMTKLGSPLVTGTTSFSASAERTCSMAVLAHPSGYYRVAKAYRSSPNHRTVVSCLIVDDSTWAVTEEGTPVEVAAAATPYPHAQRVSDTRVLVWWTDSTSGDGFTQTFDIVSDSAPAEGSASGAISWDGSSTGETDYFGESTGAISLDGSSTGTTVLSGDASGAVEWVGEATGATVHSGSASGAISWDGSSNGATVHRGEASGSVEWDGAVTGDAPTVGINEGEASGSIEWAGVVTGEAPDDPETNEGEASGSIEWAGSATGTKQPKATAIGEIIWAGSSTGASQPNGVAIGGITWAGVVIGAEFDVSRFLLLAHVDSHIPGVVVGHKPGFTIGRDGG